MGELWRDYPATESQQRRAAEMCESASPAVPPSVLPKKKPRRVPQADILAMLLRARRTEGKPLDLPEIRNLGIYQHTARIHTLRHVRGMVIENERERMADGSVHSRYWLRHDPELDGAQ